jgi:hypothetical protein
MVFTNTTTGFQNAFAAEIFEEPDGIVRAWIEAQLRASYDVSKQRLGDGAAAPALIASAICHLVDSRNVTLFSEKKSGIALLKAVLKGVND